MVFDADTTAAVIDELQPLVGGRVQRVDAVTAHEVVLEIRCPGRTVRLVVAATPGLGRLHLAPRRPPKSGEGAQLQQLLRARLTGRTLCGLAADGRTVRITLDGVRLVVDLGGGKDALQLEPSETLEAPVRGPPLPATFPVSEQIATRYGQRAIELSEDRLRRGLLAELRRRGKRCRRLLANVERDRDRLEALRDGRRYGELLKTQLSAVRRGQSSVEVMDWITGEPARVPLDPALGAKANVERYFARAKKADRGLPLVTKRLERVRVDLAAIEARRDRVQRADLEQLRALGVERTGRAPASGGANKAKPSALDRSSRRFTTVDGREVRVGRGAEANDRLTFGAARGDDLWLHARGASGAHVVLRLERGEAPPQEALLDAAHLAAFHSGARRDDKVEVVYTRARYVKRVKGAPAGRVGVSHERTMLLRIDTARLDRLLDRTQVRDP